MVRLAKELKFYIFLMYQLTVLKSALKKEVGAYAIDMYFVLLRNIAFCLPVCVLLSFSVLARYFILCIVSTRFNNNRNNKEYL